MKLYEFRCGSKKIYGVESAPGNVTLRVDCKVFPEAVIKIEVTTAQADALENRPRPAVQVIAPNMPRELREIFITGTTPAEYDELLGTVKSREGYAKLGYDFDES